MKQLAAIATSSTGAVAGDVIGRKFIVERIIGTGGTGIVVAAKHKDLGTRVAIKIGRTTDRDSSARFQRQARTLARLLSQHTVRVNDVGETKDGAPWMVMEFLEGRDFAAVLAQGGPRPTDEALRWMIQVCEAVTEAHELGIIHRGLKPQNLFLERQGTMDVIRVLDFGLAPPIPRLDDEAKKLMKVGQIAGTSHFMAPEQVRAGRIDARTDVWAAGAVLYRLLTNRYPFDGATLSDVCRGILKDQPAEIPSSKDIGSRTIAVIKKCLEKEPQNRYQNMTDLAEAMRNAREELRHTPVVTAIAKPIFIDHGEATVVPSASAVSGPLTIREDFRVTPFGGVEAASTTRDPPAPAHQSAEVATIREPEPAPFPKLRTLPPVKVPPMRDEADTSIMESPLLQQLQKPPPSFVPDPDPLPRFPTLADVPPSLQPSFPELPPVEAPKMPRPKSFAPPPAQAAPSAEPIPTISAPLPAATPLVTHAIPKAAIPEKKSSAVAERKRIEHERPTIVRDPADSILNEFFNASAGDNDPTTTTTTAAPSEPKTVKKTTTGRLGESDERPLAKPGKKGDYRALARPLEAIPPPRLKARIDPPELPPRQQSENSITSDFVAANTPYEEEKPRKKLISVPLFSSSASAAPTTSPSATDPSPPPPMERVPSAGPPRPAAGAPPPTAPMPPLPPLHFNNNPRTPLAFESPNPAATAATLASEPFAPPPMNGALRPVSPWPTVGAPSPSDSNGVGIVSPPVLPAAQAITPAVIVANPAHPSGPIPTPELQALVPPPQPQQPPPPLPQLPMLGPESGAISRPISVPSPWPTTPPPQNPAPSRPALIAMAMIALTAGVLAAFMVFVRPWSLREKSASRTTAVSTTHSAPKASATPASASAASSTPPREAYPPPQAPQAPPPPAPASASAAPVASASASASPPTITAASVTELDPSPPASASAEPPASKPGGVGGGHASRPTRPTPHPAAHHHPPAPAPAPTSILDKRK